MLLCIYFELLPLRQPKHHPIPVVIDVIVLLLGNLLELIFVIRTLSLAAA
jgi:hypothetical protein